MSPPPAFDATREDIAFASGGESCAGCLYRPAGDAAVPLNAMALRPLFSRILVAIGVLHRKRRFRALVAAA